MSLVDGNRSNTTCRCAFLTSRRVFVRYLMRVFTPLPGDFKVEKRKTRTSSLVGPPPIPSDVLRAMRMMGRRPTKFPRSSPISSPEVPGRNRPRATSEATRANPARVIMVAPWTSLSEVLTISALTSLRLYCGWLRGFPLKIRSAPKFLMSDFFTFC